MRFILKRKSDGQFYYGRDGYPKWGPDIARVFLFKTRTAAKDGRVWIRDAPRCECPKRQWYGIRHRKGCPYVVALDAKFNETYEIILATITVEL